MLLDVCVSTGELEQKESEKTVSVKPSKSAGADVQKTATADRQKVKVTTLKAVVPRTVRFKRRVTGEGNQLMCCYPVLGSIQG